MLTNLQLAQFCRQVYADHWCYWYGTYGKKCTQALYEEKKRQYPEHYTASRENGYKIDIRNGYTCADCAGLIKAFFWMGGDSSASPKYGSNGFRDRGADSIFKTCRESGPIGTIPEDVPGLVVWKPGHIGVYIGGGETIEMKGFAYDCVRTGLKNGTWTHWGRLPADVLTYVKPGDSVPAEDEKDPAEVEKPKEPDAPKRVRITGSCNMRTGNGTEYVRTGSAPRGAEFEYVATAVNGWNAIKHNGAILWVSGNYSEVIG